MTAEGWLTSQDPGEMRMLICQRRRADPWLRQVYDRKVRLLGCACCRFMGYLLGDERIVRALDVSEGHADLQSADELELVYHQALKAQRSQRRKPLLIAYAAVVNAVDPTGLFVEPSRVGEALVRAEQPHLDAAKFRSAVAARCAPLAELFRDVFGNPFGPAAAEPAWLTADVVALAQAAYGERLLPSGQLHLDWLSVLADALEDAGCADRDVLGHLRGPGPHVRGCWAVDLALGKV